MMIVRRYHNHAYSPKMRKRDNDVFSSFLLSFPFLSYSKANNSFGYLNRTLTNAPRPLNKKCCPPHRPIPRLSTLAFSFHFFPLLLEAIIRFYLILCTLVHIG